MATSQRETRRAAMGQWVGRLGWSLALVLAACGEPEAQIQPNLPNGACPTELTTFPLTPGDYTVTEASVQGSDGCLLRPAALRGTRALVIGNQASQGGLNPSQGNTGLRLFDAQSGWLVKGFVRCNVGVLQSFSFNTQRNCQFAAHREAALQIADPQVRNRGTIGGSLAHADPAADYPAAVLALGATIRTDRRTIAADDFFTGLFETSLGEGELITAVSFPIPTRSAYAKFASHASKYALVGVMVACPQQVASGIKSTQCVMGWAVENPDQRAGRIGRQQRHVHELRREGIEGELIASEVRGAEGQNRDSLVTTALTQKQPVTGISVSQQVGGEGIWIQDVGADVDAPAGGNCRGSGAHHATEEQHQQAH